MTEAVVSHENEVYEVTSGSIPEAVDSHQLNVDSEENVFDLR